MPLEAFKISLEGWDELIDRLNNAAVEIQDEAEAEVLDRAEAIAAEAKQRVPVNLGILKNTIHTEAGADKLTVAVEVSADYAAYVEFGTGTKVDVPSEPDGIEEYALTFKGSHEIPGMAARPYLFPALMRQTPIFIKRLQDILINALK